MRAPVVVSPVKQILATRGSPTSSVADRRRPGPGSTCTCSGGTPASTRRSPSSQRGERGERRRLEDDRVAAGEGGGDLPRGDQQREVPRHDQGAHARPARAARRRGPGPAPGRSAEVLVGGPGVVLEGAGRGLDLPAGVADRVAGAAWPRARRGRRRAPGAARRPGASTRPRSVALVRGHVPWPSAKAAWAARHGRVDVGRARPGRPRRAARRWTGR